MNKAKLRLIENELHLLKLNRIKVNYHYNLLIMIIILNKKNKNLNLVQKTYKKHIRTSY